MRFIHTADWHLGNSMHDIDRTEEAQKFLTWLKEQAVEKGAQALIIAGDVFDIVNPSNSAKGLYYRFLASLIGTCCNNVIVVGGNHDSGPLLDAPADLLAALNVKVVGSINNRCVENMIAELKDSSGEAIGICCCVPFMRDLELKEFYKRIDSPDGEELPQDEFFLKRLYQDVYNKAVEIRGNRDIPIVATGHLYANHLEGRPQEESMDGARLDDGVRDVVGTLGNVSLDVFPQELDYVALGHIHYETMVAKNQKIRYSGSPFVMGFDEAAQKRKVLLVDTGAGSGNNSAVAENTAKVEKLEVPRGIRFVQFKGDLEHLKQSLRELDRELVAQPEETYVELILTSGEVVNMDDALAAEEESKRFVVKRHRIQRSLLNQQAGSYSDNVESTQQYEKEDYFRMLIADREGLPQDSDEVKAVYEDFLGMFKEAVDRASIAEGEN